MKKLVGNVLVDMDPEEIEHFQDSQAGINAIEAPALPVLCCLANLRVQDGVVSGIETAVGLTLAFMVGEGIVWVFFSTPMTSVDYGWNVGGTSGEVKVTDRQLEFIEVTITNATEPVALSLQIYKVA